MTQGILYIVGIFILIYGLLPALEKQDWTAAAISGLGLFIVLVVYKGLEWLDYLLESRRRKAGLDEEDDTEEPEAEAR